jgi:hypothetical protein
VIAITDYYIDYYSKPKPKHTTITQQEDIIYLGTTEHIDFYYAKEDGDDFLVLLPRAGSPLKLLADIYISQLECFPDKKARLAGGFFAFDKNGNFVTFLPLEEEHNKAKRYVDDSVIDRACKYSKRWKVVDL